VTAGSDRLVQNAEALVRRVAQLEQEIDALLSTDCARPSLIPPALAELGSLPSVYAAVLRPKVPKKSKPRPRRSAPNDNGAEIGQRIREARRAKGLTQLELATATDIRRPNVARLERGGNTPTIETLQRVAEALGVSVASLVSGS
jgi:HTH-type transcriptional regulator / antitoxin HipB